MIVVKSFIASPYTNHKIHLQVNYSNRYVAGNNKVGIMSMLDFISMGDGEKTGKLLSWYLLYLSFCLRKD